MEMYLKINEVKSDPDFACSLELPAINVYLIYRGGAKVEYYAFSDNEALLFAGNDFRPSPLHSIDGIEAIMSLLSFLTVQKGDTEEEYFTNYTQAQLNWSNSASCEHLKGLIQDFEQGFEQDYFLSRFKYREI
jgi:hypothetical protein